MTKWKRVKDLEFESVITAFVAGKIQPTGNPVVTFTVKSAFVPQEVLNVLGDDVSNYCVLVMRRKKEI